MPLQEIYLYQGFRELVSHPAQNLSSALRVTVLSRGLKKNLSPLEWTLAISLGILFRGSIATKQGLSECGQ